MTDVLPKFRSEDITDDIIVKGMRDSQARRISSILDGTTERLAIDGKVQFPKPGTAFTVDAADIVPDQVLPINSSSSATIYSFNGAGRLYQAAVKFNNERVIFSVFADGIEVVSVNGVILKIFKDALEVPTFSSAGIRYIDARKIIQLSFVDGLEFTTSVSVRARASDGSTGRKAEAYIVQLDKD